MEAAKLIELFNVARKSKILDLTTCNNLDEANFNFIMQELTKMPDLIAIHMAHTPFPKGNNKAGMETGVQFISAITKCNSLLHLGLHWCGLDPKSIAEFFKMIEVHPSIVLVELTGNQLFQGANNSIIAQNINSLNNVLKNNHKLLSLDLSENSIEDFEQGNRIANAIKQNNTLLRLSLGDGLRGVDQIAIDNQLEKNRSAFIKQLSESTKLPMLKDLVILLNPYNDDEPSSLASNPIVYIGSLQAKRIKANTSANYSGINADISAGADFKSKPQLPKTSK